MSVLFPSAYHLALEHYTHLNCQEYDEAKELDCSGLARNNLQLVSSMSLHLTVDALNHIETEPRERGQSQGF